MGHLGSSDCQYLLLLCTLLDLHMFIPYPFVWGPIAPNYSDPTIGAHHVLSPKTTLAMPPK
jgi:hypothetical protein